MRLAAQRQIYSDASELDNFGAAISIFVPVVLSILGFLTQGAAPVTTVSRILSAIATIVSLGIKGRIKHQKALAAAIQQDFDVYVYQMPWDADIFGTWVNHDSEVAEKADKFFSNPRRRDSLRNWYVPESDNLPLLDGIAACQRENTSWSKRLVDRYRQTYWLIFVVVFLAVVVPWGISDGPAHELSDRIFTVFPLLTWVLTTICALREGSEKVCALDATVKTHEPLTMHRLQLIQKSIWDYRATNVKIPNWFYAIFRGKDERIERHAIALQRSSGSGR